MSDEQQRALKQSECCDLLGAKYVGVEVSDVPELRERLRALPVSPGYRPSRFRCRHCGQSWEEHFVPAMHATTVVVVKAGISPTIWVEAGAPPKAEQPEEFRYAPSGTPSDFGALAGLFIGLFIGYAWLDGWWIPVSLFTGLLAGAMVGWAIGRRKKN